ncbi:unnamed protein product, partial [Trichogramma brassicae]
MVHHIAANRRKFYYWRSDVCELLSNVYDRLDVIYSDESGMTHFHVACMTRSPSVVARFLDSGRDPNYRVRGTDDTPLLLALKEHRMEMVEFLLRRGANPNLANAKGLTLLHAIIKDGRWLKEFFEIVDDVGLTVQIDPRDNFGRTPLQWAVAHLRPTMIDALLGRGADLSRFVFPTAGYFGKKTRSRLIGDDFYVAFSIPKMVAVLEKRGYEFSRSDALIVMKYFAQRKMFLKPSNLVQPCHKKIMIRKDLSLYDVIQLQPKEALKLVKFEDYYTMTALPSYWAFLDAKATGVAHLSEKLSRGFLKRWALDPFMELIHYRLPILCCEMIMDNLSNEDLFNICQAAAIRTKRKPNRKYKRSINSWTRSTGYTRRVSCSAIHASPARNCFLFQESPHSILCEPDTSFNVSKHLRIKIKNSRRRNTTMPFRVTQNGGRRQETPLFLLRHAIVAVTAVTHCENESRSVASLDEDETESITSSHEMECDITEELAESEYESDSSNVGSQNTHEDKTESITSSHETEWDITEELAEFEYESDSSNVGSQIRKQGFHFQILLELVTDTTFPIGQLLIWLLLWFAIYLHTPKFASNLITWENSTEPPLTKDLSNDELLQLVETHNSEAPIFLYPCHSQAVERGVKTVSETSLSVCSEELRQALVRNKLKPGQFLPSFETKKDFK